MAIAEWTDTRRVEGYLFPEKLVDQNTATARHYDALLRGLTHKMNNLLAVIQGFSSLVLMQEDLDEMSRENVQHMKEAAGSASSLGERVLPAAGVSRVELSEVSLGEAVPLLMTRLRGRVESCNVPFRGEVGKALPAVVADPDRLRLVLDELVKNAIEATGMGGEVSVRIENGEGRGAPGVDFFVSNVGPEIPADQMEQIFQPFFTTKDNSHLGLGLTTAHVMAGHMGMDLGVKSENGHTVFWLRARAA